MTNPKNTDDLIEDANASLSQSQLHDIGGVKTKNNRFIMGLLFTLAALLLLTVTGLKVYKNFFRKEKPAESVSAADENDLHANKRTDLGKNYDPVDNKSTPSNTSAETEPSSESHQPEFKKFLSIPVSNGEGSNHANSYRRETRSIENTNNSLKEEKNSLKLTPPMRASVITLDPNLYIEANTIIPCALMTRFVSDVAGRVNCVITEDVWSANHHVKLIEKGTKAFGSYKTGTLRQGQGRMFVIWEQLRTPDFKRIDLVDTAATGALGEAGIAGWIDSHFWERFGGALMLSTVQDVAAAAANNVSKKDRNVDYTENSREALAQLAKVTLENTINIPPTMYKNQGDIIAILVGDDIDFSNIYQLKAR